MYDPIYSQNIGLCGFRCRVVDSAGKSCTKVVRTYRGIVMHCKRKHGLVAQMQLFGDAPAVAENIKESKDGKRSKRRGTSACSRAKKRKRQSRRRGSSPDSPATQENSN